MIDCDGLTAFSQLKITKGCFQTHRTWEQNRHHKAWQTARAPGRPSAACACVLPVAVPAGPPLPDTTPQTPRRPARPTRPSSPRTEIQLSPTVVSHLRSTAVRKCEVENFRRGQSLSASSPAVSTSCRLLAQAPVTPRRRRASTARDAERRRPRPRAPTPVRSRLFLLSPVSYCA